MKAEEKSISEIFADNNSYEIPNYQRPYSWNQDNVSDLVNDINDAFENGVKEYFIGSIITIEKDVKKQFEVVDGQQRLTTITLIFSALRNLITKAISALSAIFVSYLSLKTAVASRADALGLRSVRFAINSVVPIIGSSISEGLLSIQSYSSLIKTSVGIVGIIAISAIFLPAIINITLWRLSISAANICSKVFFDSESSTVLEAFSSVLLIINVLLILSMVTTIISLGILVASKTVNV